MNNRRNRWNLSLLPVRRAAQPSPGPHYFMTFHIGASSTREFSRDIATSDPPPRDSASQPYRIDHIEQQKTRALVLLVEAGRKPDDTTDHEKVQPDEEKHPELRSVINFKQKTD